MKDTDNCPICNSVLNCSNKKDAYLYEIKSWGDFSVKVCPGANHFLKIISNSQKQIVWIMCSLSQFYTKFIIIDYHNQCCHIVCSKHNVKQQIKIDKLLHPDFPQLQQLKEKVNMYLALS